MVNENVEKEMEVVNGRRKRVRDRRLKWKGDKEGGKNGAYFEEGEEEEEEGAKIVKREAGEKEVLIV